MLSKAKASFLSRSLYLVIMSRRSVSFSASCSLKFSIYLFFRAIFYSKNSLSVVSLLFMSTRYLFFYSSRAAAESNCILSKCPFWRLSYWSLSWCSRFSFSSYLESLMFSFWSASISYLTFAYYVFFMSASCCFSYSISLIWMFYLFFSSFS